MTRKLLSGVLAFAMVFGCTAPVALAEDTAVEEIEQYAAYVPSLSETSAAMKNGDSKIITVSGIDGAATIEATGSANVDATVSGHSVILVAKGNLSADEVITIKINDDNNGYTTRELTFTAKKPSTDTIVGTIPSTINVTTGDTTKLDFYWTTATTAPTVTYKVATYAQDYVSVATSTVTKDGKTGTRVTITGLKATPTDANADKVKITIAIEGAPTEATVKVTDAASVSAITLQADNSTVTTGTDAGLAANAYTINAYGELTRDDNATKGLVWYVNGVKMGSGKGTYEYKVAEDPKDPDTKTKYAELRVADSGIAKLNATVAGTYTIEVKDAAGTQTGKQVIVVKEVRNLTTRDELYPAKSEKDLTPIATKDRVVTVKPGATVDLSKLVLAIQPEPSSAPSSAPTLLSNYEKVTVSYSVSNPRLVSEFDKKTGVMTIEDSDDVDLKNAMDNDDATAELIVTVKATQKQGSSDVSAKTFTYTIKVSNAAKTIKKVEYSIGGKAFYVNDYVDGVTDNGLPVMTVGKTVDVDAKLTDINGFTDGINQGVIWEIRNYYNSDKTVYATVDANGVITPLVKCTGMAELVAVPVADTSTEYCFKLYIMEDPTATVAPTTAPTAAPTQAPETKTGTVNTSSSALNIRAAASTTAGVVTKAAKGSTVTILGEENGFYKVKLADGTIGYASKAYIKVVTDTPVETATATTTANLRLRTSAPSGSVITTMPKGSTVTVLEKGASWSKVEYNGKVGYASNSYLTFNTVG